MGFGFFATPQSERLVSTGICRAKIGSMTIGPNFGCICGPLETPYQSAGSGEGAWDVSAEEAAERICRNDVDEIQVAKCVPPVINAIKR